MAITLKDTFDIKEVAFTWGEVTRVYRNNNLTIFGKEDIETWVSAARKNKHSFSGVWLIFELSSAFFQRISPSDDTGNGWTDVKNAILDNEINVNFHPIYSVDDSISYTIIPMAENQSQLLKTERGLAYPEVEMKFITEDQLDEYPAWLENSRYRQL